MQKTKNLLFSGVLAISLAVAIQGCGGSSAPAIGQSGQKTPVTENTTPQVSSDKPYIKKKITHLENEPSSFRKYALAASGQIRVRNTLTTDGPLADVHANGPIVAKTRSLDISGKITSKNQLTDAITRSYDYHSNLADDDMITIRALKVSEYLNLNNITEYIHLSDNGKITKVTDAGTQELSSIDGVQVDYKDGTWTISGSDITIKDTLKVDGNLKIDSDYTFVSGALLVTGNLQANGELNINVGTPFDSALVVNNSITVDKLTTIGRIHASGDFTAKGKLNIIGNAEIDGNVDLFDDAKINMLDNVYKAALADAQEESEESGIDLTLAHAQLFSDVKGNNSVMLFTFVEGNYLMDEHTINKLIESGDIKDFKFRSYLYGASLEYGSRLSKIDGLSSFYKNLLTVKKELSKKYGDIKVKSYIDIAPSNLYCQFTDANGQDVGVYLIYSLAIKFNKDNLVKLTAETKDKAIYDLNHKDDIEREEENNAKVNEDKQIQSIIESNDLNFTIKSNILNQIEADDANESNIDKVRIIQEANTDRIHEWLDYKELKSDKKIINIDEVIIEQKSKQRGWWKKLKKRIKKIFKKVTFTECKKISSDKTISYVSTNIRNSMEWWANSTWNNTIQVGDDWERYIQLNNPSNSLEWDPQFGVQQKKYSGFCVQISAAMIINYHRLKKHKDLLYDQSYEQRYYRPYRISLVEDLSKKFDARDDGYVAPWNMYWKVPFGITQELRSNSLWGYSYTTTIFPWNIMWKFYTIQYDIKRNDPPMIGIGWGFSIKDGNNNTKYLTGHTMPVIGYKREHYKGWCWKRIMPEKKWLFVDTTWGHKSWMRFDIRANYYGVATLTRIKVW